jgi:hypothetical protein
MFKCNGHGDRAPLHVHELNENQFGAPGKYKDHILEALEQHGLHNSHENHVKVSQ